MHILIQKLNKNNIIQLLKQFITIYKEYKLKLIFQLFTALNNWSVTHNLADIFIMHLFV